jgi:hypothetical protein
VVNDESPVQFQREVLKEMKEKQQVQTAISVSFAVNESRELEC